jgi:hypothetical protein
VTSTGWRTGKNTQILGAAPGISALLPGEPPGSSPIPNTYSRGIKTPPLERRISLAGAPSLRSGPLGAAQAPRRPNASTSSVFAAFRTDVGKPPHRGTARQGPTSAYSFALAGHYLHGKACRSAA